MIRRLSRYAIAAAGPIASAGAQFVLSLVLLRVLDRPQFGSFAFLLVASQFSWGLWSALFCAPLPIILNRGDAATRERLQGVLFSANLIVAALGGVVFWLVSLSLDVPAVAAVLFGLYGYVALLRWFARAYAYASGTPLRTMASDLVYSGALLVGIGLILWAGEGSLVTAYGALLAGAVFGLLPFGRSYLKAQFGDFSPRLATGYAAVWREHSGWSLIGVLTTEATANAHAYIVTGLFGPASFAALAASALMIRPIGVAMNALTEFERAQMARAIGQGEIANARVSLFTFRAALIAVWLGTALLVAAIMSYNPGLVFPERYGFSFLVTGAALWMAVALVRLLRTPESALLQAAGAFKPLALASVASSGVSIVAVLILLFSAGTLWSIVGILIGEGVYAVWIWRQAGRWLRHHDPDARAAASKRTSVVILAPHFQEYSLLLANGLARHGRVTLVLDRARLESEYQGRHMPLAGGVTLVDAKFEALSDIVRIAAVVRRSSADVVHIQEASGLKKAVICAGVAIARPRRSLLVLTVHDPHPHEGRDARVAKRLEPVRRFLRRRAELVVVHGPACRDAYLEREGEQTQRLLTLDHGVILGGDASAPPASGPGHRTRLIHFGRMEAYKGVGILLEAVRILSDRHVDFTLDLAGSGPELDRLEDEFRALGHVRVENAFIPSARLIEMIRASDCVVLPYLDATQSGVVAAAFANCRFVVATRVGGIPDVVTDGVNGLLVPPRDPQALAEAIEKIVVDQNFRERLSAAACQTAKKKLAWPGIADELWRAYLNE